MLDVPVRATSKALVSEGTTGKVTDLRRLPEGFVLRVSWASGQSDWLTRREFTQQVHIFETLG
jgi:hypothetical protein